MKLYAPGDRVEVNIRGGLGDVSPQWVTAVVTGPTDSRYGWTPATTDSPWHPRIERGPGWLQTEIRETNS